jgi:hypothetical protein
MGSNSITNYVDNEGSELSARQRRLSPTSIKVSWTIPDNPIAYNGAIVVCSPIELNPSNFPTDGVRYTASSSLNHHADQIGRAQVVGAFYDDLITEELVITDLEANKAYYIAVHLASNVYSYYQLGSRSYPSSNTSTVYAGKIEEHYEPPENPASGQTYYDPAQGILFVWDGSSWTPSMAHTVITGDTNPKPPFDGLPTGYPRVGDYFYNTRVKALKTWNGTAWDDTETPKGEPIYSTIGIGTSGEPSARDNIKTILKYQLGYPAVCVELHETHFDIALNNALQELRRRTDSAYYKQYIFMTVLKNQDVYYLNDPTTGTRSIVDVLKIHRLNMLGLTNFGPDNIYAQQFLNQFYAPGNGYDLVSVHLVHALSDTYTQLFAGDVAYSWREATRELRLFRKMGHNEKVLVECSMEKMEQELLVDRWTQQWIQQWAEAELMFMLAHIRGKFASLPGPGGGLSLNADSLMSEGQRLQDDCLRQIRDFEVGQNGPDNFYAPFIIG